VKQIKNVVEISFVRIVTEWGHSGRSVPRRRPRLHVLNLRETAEEILIAVMAITVSVDNVLPAYPQEGFVSIILMDVAMGVRA
jgi:hypothetical protein